MLKHYKCPVLLIEFNPEKVNVTCTPRRRLYIVKFVKVHGISKLNNVAQSVEICIYSSTPLCHK